MMFKILIADDERFIRQGIISILERNLKEAVECIEAPNGIEALKLVQQEKPNLIITDINMPGCDGLEFVRKIQEKSIYTTVIILSGYENFEYAKRAITLGVKEYVMKPIKKAEFISLVERYMRDIKAQQEKSKEEIEWKIENARIIDRLRRDFLLGLLKCSDNRESEQFLIQLKGLGISFESRLYTCVVFQYEVNEENAEYMDFVVKNILDEFLHLESEQFITNVTEQVGRTVSIFESRTMNDSLDELKKMISQAARLVREYCKVRVFAGISDTVADSIQFHSALKHAVIASDFKIFDTCDIVCAYAEIADGDSITPPFLVRHLRRAEEIQPSEVINQINLIYQTGKNKAVLNVLRQEYEGIQEYVKGKLLKHRLSDEEKEIELKNFSDCFQIEQLKQEVIRLLKQLQNSKEDTAPLGNAQLMKQILAYVDENITNELDLNILAEVFNRSPGYISTLFKRYVEGGFHTYITNKRIALAKKLLKDRSIPIQDTAEACGYYNAKYFSVVFKKHTGLSPREYRELAVTR